MNSELLLQGLEICLCINFGLVLWWFLFFVFAHDFVYRLHSRWFKVSVEQFDAIHYAGLAMYKILIFLFNLAPYIALTVLSE